MTIQLLIEILQGLGGVGAIGILVRWVYRSLSKTHRQAVEADTTRDLVDVATQMLKPAEDQIGRLSQWLAEAEARAGRLASRIKELETEASAREHEMEILRSQLNELRESLLSAQLEVVRLQGLVNGAP